MKDRGALTEPMFYVLMSFLRSEMCGIEITEFVARKTHGRVRLGPGTLYTEAWERLSCEPYMVENLPDDYYVQITCLDLDPYDKDGTEIVVSVGDLKSETVCGVYHYTGAVYDDVGGPDPADYMGRMWGGANFKVDANFNMASELLYNPYQAQNGYQYLSSGVQPDWEGEVDYAKYRYAISGQMTLRERYEALNE